jgi:phage baseplate assembly protein V
MSGFQTEENDRRLANIAQMGIVKEVDYNNPPRARVQVGELLTGWLRMGTRRAGDAHESWAYSVGEEVLVISTSGNLAQGVIVCALANGNNASDTSEGTFKTIYPGGAVVEVSGGAITVTSPGKVFVNADVVVDGDVIASGISLVEHVHGGVLAGPANTGAPK